MSDLDWRGRVVAMLHNEKITQRRLASEMGLTYQYVCMILSGQCNGADMETRMNEALDRIIQQRKDPDNEQRG